MQQLWLDSGCNIKFGGAVNVRGQHGGVRGAAGTRVGRLLLLRLLHRGGEAGVDSQLCSYLGQRHRHRCPIAVVAVRN